MNSAKLLKETKDSLTAYADVSRELAARIVNCRNHFLNLEQFISLLKTKELTYSRISRALFHILLGITKQNMENCLASGYVCYARLLGFREEDTPFLKLIKDRAQIPVLTKLSKGAILEEPGKAMLEADLYAADLYESVATDRFHTAFTNEKQQQIIKLT